MWDAIHLWSGIGMIIVLVIHIAVHDKWILAMFKRFFQGKSKGIKRMNRYAQFNILLDVVAALSFLVVAASGVALLFLPSGRSFEVVVGFFLSKATWDIIHTWSGVVMLISAILHFYIHWKWITKVTKRVIGIKKTEILAKGK
jgi:cytochrome b subunit of formate dehydrogenase